MKLRKLIALLAALMMVVGMMPLSVFAAMGGDFPWTESEDKMLVEEIIERDGMIDGIWFPWLDGGRCGHNLTGNDLMAKYYNEPTTTARFVDWNSVELDRLGADTIYRQIYNLKAMGYNMMAYAGSIYAEGVIFDDNGDVLGIKEEYLNNARRLLDMCREIGMPVMWNVYFHSSTTATYYGIDGWKVMCQMLGNPVVADHYAERFVKPLCQMLAEYTDVVALVSIADEPENEINDDGKGDHFGNERAMYGVTQDDMIYFMQQINETVRQELPGVARTVASCGKNKAIYRDFNLDLMGHHEYNNGANVSSVEEMVTDADAILTEYNIGGDVFYTDDEYTQKLIEFRQKMVNGGYKGGFQWCWMPGGSGYEGFNGSWAGYLLRNDQDNTAFRKTVTDLRYYIDEYRAEYRGEDLGLMAPVLYANAGDGIVKFIPSRNATKITIQRSDDGGNSWTTLVSNANQSKYVDQYLVGTYNDASAPESGYCYRIIATDGWDTVTSVPNNVAGAAKKFNKEYVKPTFKLGEYYVKPTVSDVGAKLTSFTVEKNRPFAQAHNLIQNGGFESADGQWNNDSFLQYGSVVEDATTPDGDKSLYFDTSDKSQAGWYTFVVSGLKKNTNYTFSSFLKGAYLADDNKGMASIGVLDPDTGNFMVYWEYYRYFQRASRDTQQLYPTAWDNDWHLRAVSFNSGDKTSVTIALYGYSSKLWVDGMALFESANGIKYENGDSAKALTSDEWEDLSSTATNAVADPGVNNAAYWNTGAGYKQGFMSVVGGKLNYAASVHPAGVRYTKWIDVKKNTDYYVSFTVRVTGTGNGRVAILDNAKTLPNEVASISFSSTGTKTYKGRISTGKYDQLGLCVVDLGGSATIDDVCFYEAGGSIMIPTDPSFDGYLTNGTFEVGTINGWENLWGSSSISFVEGRESLFAMSVNANLWNVVRQKVTVEPYTDYVVEVWSKGCSNAALLVKNSADDANLAQKELNGTSSWSKTMVEFNSGDNEFVYVGMLGTADGAYYTVDDVKMRPKTVESYDGYLYNGDFEVGTANRWENLWGNNTVTVVGGHNSAYAMSVVAKSEFAHVRQAGIAVSPNTNYVVELWCKNAVNTTLLIKDGGDTTNIKETTLPSGSSWTKVTLEFNSGNYASVIVTLMSNQANAEYTVDDVAMYEKPTESGLLNGGFENGKQNWNFASGSHAIVTDSYEGDYALQLQNPEMWAPGAEQEIAVEPNSYYAITWYYKATPGTGLFNLYVMDGSSYENLVVEYGENYMSYYSGDWQRGSMLIYTCGMETGTPARSMLLKFSTEAYNPGTILIDNVTVIRSCLYHEYDNTCTDADCNVCGEIREVTGHTYYSSCDKECYVCGELRDVPGHNYVIYNRVEPTCGNYGGIEYTCVVCGDWYEEYLPATGNHTYGGVCDAYCNGCGEYRYTYYSHVYDNACDDYCNRCDEWRSVPGHTTDYPCLSGTCIYCGTWINAIYSHDYDSYCDEYCNECGTYRVTYESHYAGTEYPCQAGCCYYCDAYVEATQDHSFPYACTEECTMCGQYNYDAAEHQSDATSPCEDGECVVCGVSLPSPGHQYSADCDITCNACDHIRSDAVIRNGDFELGWQEWSCWKELEESHQIVTDAHSGDFALQLTDPETWGEAATQIVAVEPYTTYTITWWSKAERGTGTFNLFLMDYDKVLKQQEANLTLVENYKTNWMNGHTGQWRQHLVKVETGEATKMLVKISTQDYRPGTILIDDMVIPGSESITEHVYAYGCSQVCSICCELTRPEADHVYDASCSLWCWYCDEKRLDPVEHDFVIDIIEPTCQNEGSRIYVCQRCYYEYDEPIPSSHKYDNDCDAECNSCGAVRYGETTLSFANTAYRDEHDSSSHQKWSNGNLVMVNNRANSSSSIGTYYDPVRIYANSTVTISYPGMTKLVLNSYNSTTYLNALTTTLNRSGLSYVKSGTVYTITFAQPVDSITLTAAGQFRLYSMIATSEWNHIYDNDCDAECNSCGAVRDAGHTYSYDCDKRCAKCGALTRPEAEHKYFNVCDAVCLLCYEKTNPDAAHDIIHVQEKPATCTESGNKEYWHCERCGAIWLDAECTKPTDLPSVSLPMVDHSYEAVVTAPDCENGGYTTHTCSGCGDTYVDEYTTALGHDYGAVVTAPDCENGGYTTHTCSGCGDTYVDEYTTALGHDYANEYDVNCDVCGNVRQAEMPISFSGNSVSQDVSGLAFRFDVQVEGMTTKGSVAVYDNATVDGYKLLSMGALVSNGGATLDAPAVYLWEVTDATASFAVRVVKIPDFAYNVAITATPYIVLEIDGVATTIYGETQTCSYNDAMN